MLYIIRSIYDCHQLSHKSIILIINSIVVGCLCHGHLPLCVPIDPAHSWSYITWVYRRHSLLLDPWFQTAGVLEGKTTAQITRVLLQNKDRIFGYCDYHYRDSMLVMGICFFLDGFTVCHLLIKSMIYLLTIISIFYILSIDKNVIFFTIPITYPQWHSIFDNQAIVWLTANSSMDVGDHLKVKCDPLRITWINQTYAFEVLCWYMWIWS